jgi:hypothetical protein
MAVFVLAFYSCVTFNDFGGDLASKTCHWSGGTMYSTTEKCNNAGMAAIGNPIFSDIAEDRKVEKYSCTPISID